MTELQIRELARGDVPTRAAIVYEALSKGWELADSSIGSVLFHPRAATELTIIPTEVMEHLIKERMIEWSHKETLQ